MWQRAGSASDLALDACAAVMCGRAHASWGLVVASAACVRALEADAGALLLNDLRCVDRWRSLACML